MIFQFFGLTGAFIAVSVFVVVVIGYVALARRGLDGEKIVPAGRDWSCTD